MSRAIVIGSGVAGSFMAHKLLDLGVSEVVMLEAGREIPMGDPAWWFRFVATGRTPYQDDYDTTEDFTSTGYTSKLEGPWAIVGSRIMGRGGTTLHWGGWTPRFRPEDFRMFTNTGLGIDWPYDYATLEPFYLQAESWLGVCGDSKEEDPWRSGPYPFEAGPFPLNASPFIEAFENLDYNYGHLPVARYGLSENGSSCRTTGTCDYCPVAGRFTGDLPLKPLHERQGFTLRLGSPVSRLRMDGRSRVAGVSGTDLSSGKPFDLDADAVFLCGGAFETPKLLLASACNEWPNGVGNDNDLVGRYLVANAFFFTNGIRANPKRMTQELGFPSLVSRQFDTEKEQATAKLFMTMNYSKPYIDLGAGMAKGQDRAALDASLVAPTSFQLYGNVSPLPQRDNRIGLAKGTTRFGLPRTNIDTPAPGYNEDAARKWMGVMEGVLNKMDCENVKSGTYPQRGDHASCTTRMAMNENEGVVDPMHRVFGVKNLCILSNSILPTLPAANPTLTLVAMGCKLVKEQGAKLVP